MREWFFLSVLISLLIGGCKVSGLTDAELDRLALARKIRLVEASGGLVLMVGGETITSDEIVESPVELGGEFISPREHFKPLAQVTALEQFKEQARGQLKEILSAKISNILLYQQAKRQAGQNIEEALDKEAEKALREYILGFGGDQAKADESLEQRGMDWKSFKEHQKRFILTRWYLGSKFSNNRPVTYGELMDGYNEMKDEFFARPAIIQFRLIDIQPARMQPADPNADRRELAKKWAGELLARAKSGEDFEELAKQYSHGPMREFGGFWRPVKPTSLAAPYDMLAAEAENTEPGQITNLVIAPEHIFIMKLEEKQLAGYEPFDKVQKQVEKKVLFDRQNVVIDELNARIMQEAELSETGEFIDVCLEKIYQMRNQTVKVKRNIYRGTETPGRRRKTTYTPGTSMGIPGSMIRR